MSGITTNPQNPGGGTSFPATTDLSMGSHKLTNVTDPASNQDAATKKYVDTAVAAVPITLISSQTITGAGTATITFSSIPGTHKALRLQYQCRTASKTGDNDTLVLRFNDDTGANYSIFYVQQSGAGSLSGGQSSGKTSFNDIMAVTNDNAGSAYDATSGTMDIPNYAGTTFGKHVTFQALADFSAGALGVYWYNNAGLWTGTSAVTKITIATGSGSDFLTGTVFSLYGIG